MPKLMPWTIVEIGDLDIFAPALPSFVVYTWYVDDEPESTITHFWSDEGTGMVHHELILVASVPFAEAVARAEEEAPKRSVERIHVKHARSSDKPKAKTKRPTKHSAAPAKKPASTKRKVAKAPTKKQKKPT